MTNETRDTPKTWKLQRDGNVWHWPSSVPGEGRTPVLIPYTFTAHLVTIGRTGTHTHVAWPDGKGTIYPRSAICYSGRSTLSRDLGIITDPSQVTCEKCLKKMRKVNWHK